MEAEFITFKDIEEYDIFLNINALTGFTIKQVSQNPYKYIIAWTSIDKTGDSTTVHKNTMERIRGIMLEHSLA